MSGKPSFPMTRAVPGSGHPFYIRALRMLQAARIDFVVGGAYAVGFHCGIERDTKDLDVMVRPEDCQRILDLFAREGYPTELTYPHWLGKIFSGDHFIDVIFSSGNGLCVVDDLWFLHAPEGAILGIPVRICPVEEMIWSKTYIMERERFDGADVVHLLLAAGKRMDWPRLLKRFERHSIPFLMHLLAFQFVYPCSREVIPDWVLRDLLSRLEKEGQRPPDGEICRGTLLSLSQYQIDIERWGFRDGRLPPEGKLTQKEITNWVDSFR